MLIERDSRAIRQILSNDFTKQLQITSEGENAPPTLAMD
jgi:hypothetical protein